MDYSSPVLNGELSKNTWQFLDSECGSSSSVLAPTSSSSSLSVDFIATTSTLPNPIISGFWKKPKKSHLLLNWWIDSKISSLFSCDFFCACYSLSLSLSHAQRHRRPNMCLGSRLGLWRHQARVREVEHEREREKNKYCYFFNLELEFPPPFVHMDFTAQVRLLSGQTWSMIFHIHYHKEKHISVKQQE